jgi:hypothetical protein
MTAIENAASLKEEITSFKKELTDLKKKKTGLSQANTAAKAEVIVVEKEVGCCSKPVRKGLESIPAKEWNIKQPSWHGGDILGDECRKLMAWARLVCNQMKAFLLEKMVEDGASEPAKKEVTKRCDFVRKMLAVIRQLPFHFTCRSQRSHSRTHRESQRTRNNKSLGSVTDADSLCDTKVSRIGTSCRRSTRVPTGPSGLL